MAYSPYDKYRENPERVKDKTSESKKQNRKVIEKQNQEILKAEKESFVVEHEFIRKAKQEKEKALSIIEYCPFNIEFKFNITTLIDTEEEYFQYINKKLTPEELQKIPLKFQKLKQADEEKSKWYIKTKLMQKFLELGIIELLDPLDPNTTGQFIVDIKKDKEQTNTFHISMKFLNNQASTGFHGLVARMNYGYHQYYQDNEKDRKIVNFLEQISARPTVIHCVIGRKEGATN